MKYFGWVFLFFILVYIFPLASRPLFAPNEFFCAETAREMLISRSCSIPELPDAEVTAPPLAQWMTIGSMQLFGINNFAARFPMAAAVGLISLFIWILIKESSGDEKLAALASIIWLSCSSVYLCGTSAIAETVSAMFTVGAAGCIFLALREKSFNRRKVLLTIITGVMTAGSFMAGALPGVIILTLTAVGYIVFERRWKELPLLVLPIPLIAAGAVSPWVMNMNCGFQTYCKLLFQSQISSSAPFPWYMVPVMLICGAFPVVLLFPAACLVGRDAWPRLLRLPLYRFALCFLLLPLIYFCFPVMRKASWLLPCFAPVSVLIAAGVRAYFNSGGHHRSYNWTMTIWGVMLILSGMALVAATIFPAIIPDCIHFEKFPVSPLFAPIIGFISILSGTLMLYSLTGNWRGRLYLFFFGIGFFPLCGNFMITENHLMPEAIYRKQLDTSVYPFAVSRTVYTESKAVPQLRWSLRNSPAVILPLCLKNEQSAVKKLTSSAVKTPVTVVCHGKVPASLPQPSSRTESHGITFSDYTAVSGE